jgi:putative transposase
LILIFHALARQKEWQILEGHLMPDHVDMCIAIPTKHPVASAIGFLKGKSAIAIARLRGREPNFSGEHFSGLAILVRLLVCISCKTIWYLKPAVLEVTIPI